MSKSVPVRKALKKVLVDNSKKNGPATKWAVRWRGMIIASKSITPNDKRAAQILKKHVL